MLESVRTKKINRLLTSKKPRVFDLFAGCGGLSLGFQSAGFQIVGAIENDEFAIRTHAENFFKGASSNIKNFHAEPTDITRIEPKEVVEKYDLGDLQMAVDALIGGPPCQAFARVGRAKLREVEAHPSAYLNDPRSNLYIRFIHYVKELQPIIIVMENVPDSLNYGNHNIAEETCEVLEDLGYTPRYTLLNSVYYGVPQMRERMFLIAYANELHAQVTFPQPTHWIELPNGYNGSRMVALKSLGVVNRLFNKDHYISPPKAAPNMIPAVTAAEALSDLPPITEHLEGGLKRGARRFNLPVKYPPNARISKYARLMRNWKQFSSTGYISDHVIRRLPRDYQIFNVMNPGDQYPEAYRHALQLFERALSSYRKKGVIIKRGSKEYLQLKKRIVPPYDPSKFPNKWRKMEADKPARTLMAHLGKDSYSHIHYDSAQARTISVREAARLQSFPDGFTFSGTMNPAFRQIGNAVPPLMARALVDEILKNIKRR